MLPNIGIIPTYSIFLIIGIVVIIVYYIMTRERYSLPWYIALILGLMMAVFEVVSAKLLFYIEMPMGLEFGIRFDGYFCLFGVFFFVPIFLFITTWMFRIEYIDLFDYLFPVGLLQLAIFRIGCTLRGCCYGIEVGWGITNGHENGLFPVQPLEAILDVAAFILITYLTTKKKLRRGEAFYLTYFSYGLIRFLTEFLRQRWNIVSVFSLDHFFALAILIFGLAMLLRSRLSKKCKLYAY